MKILSKVNFLLKSTLAMALMTVFVLTSCQSDLQEPTAETIETSALEAESIAETSFEEIDDIAANIMGVAESGIGGRIEGDKHDFRCGCAEITHDTENMIITIDFGDGCEGPGGVVRKGKIIITYTDRRFIPGASWTTTFEEYFVNDKQIEGIRTVTNISESLESFPTFNIVLEDGKVTWPDGTFATREVNRTRMWIRNDNPLMDEHHILTGSVASGTNKEGVNYTTEVLTDLVYKTICKLDRVRIPVQGTKQVIYGDRDCTVDFGDGECDNIVEVTCGDVVETFDLSEGRFRKRNSGN